MPGDAVPAGTAARATTMRVALTARLVRRSIKVLPYIWSYLAPQPRRHRTVRERTEHFRRRESRSLCTCAFVGGPRRSRSSVLSSSGSPRECWASPGRRFALLLLSVAAACGGLGLFAIASGWWATILASAVLGCGVGLLDAAVNTEAALRGDIRFMGALHGAWAIGASLGPPLVGATLVASDSWRPAYVAAAAAFALLGVALYALPIG